MKRTTDKAPQATRTVVREGRVHQVPAAPAAAPKLPTDWESVILKAVLAVSGALTLVTIAWSTYSIGDLLGGSWPAYGGASVYDAVWVAVLGLEYLARYETARRKRLARFGFVLLAASMAAILAHGGLTPAGFVGAGIALGSKLLWAAAMMHLHRDLDPDTAAWVEAEQQEAHAVLATARVHRRTAQARAEAAAHRLALEHRYGPGTVVTAGRADHGHGQEDDVVQDVADADVADVEPEPEHDSSRLWEERDHAAQRATVDQIRARAIASTHGTRVPEWHEAALKADLSLADAQRHGVSAEEILARVERQRAMVQPRAASPDRAPRIPETPVSAHVTASPDASGLRMPGVDLRKPEPSAPAPDGPSARATVHFLYGQGMTDPDRIGARIEGLIGTRPSTETISRYVREARRAAAPESQPETAADGQGQYL